MGDLSDNFSRWEFACRGKECCGNSAPISMVLVTSLQTLRNQIGVPITVTSGFRCKVHNVAVSKIEKSEHSYGTAADIFWGQEIGLTAKEMAEIAETIPAFRLGGIGSDYEDPDRIHVDVRRNGPARW